ncbi:MAG: IS1380 family transposase [Acidobacteriota bacterium]
MSEFQDTLFRLDFNRSVKIEARRQRLTGDAGALLLRELMGQLGIDEYLAERLADPRDQDVITHPWVELLRTTVLLLSQGWRDLNDAQLLRDDPVLRLSVSERRGDAPLRSVAQDALIPEGLASQPTLSRLQHALSTLANRAGLQRGLVETAIRRVQATEGGPLEHATIDLDSLPIEVWGNQDGAAYNGHFGHRGYHPILASVAETGDLLATRLRAGNAHTADGAHHFVHKLIDQLQGRYAKSLSLRMDAGFPEDNLLSGLEKRGVPYICRIRKNPVLQRMAEPLVRRPPGRPPKEPRTWLYELTYRAGEWSRQRRVVLVVQERPGELFLHTFFLLTSFSAQEMPAAKLLQLYRRRGKAEGHFGELVNVVDPALSSTNRPKSTYAGKPPAERAEPCDPFAVNEVRLLLAGIAYNLLHTGRALLEAITCTGWSLERFVTHVLKVPARVLLGGRSVTVAIGQLVAAHWYRLLARIQQLRWQPCAVG